MIYALAVQGATVSINDRTWTVEVMATPAELNLGLSYRDVLAPDNGMLFDLGQTRAVLVNAYNMLFPISIVFIDENFVVTDVVQLLSPGEDVATAVPCRYFLEVNEQEAVDVEVGDSVIVSGYTSAGNMSLMLGLLVGAMIFVMMTIMMTRIIAKQ